MQKQKKQEDLAKMAPCEICRICRLVTENKIILFALTMSFIAERKSKGDNLCQNAGEESLKMFNKLTSRILLLLIYLRGQSGT